MNISIANGSPTALIFVIILGLTSLFYFWPRAIFSDEPFWKNVSTMSAITLLAGLTGGWKPIIGVAIIGSIFAIINCTINLIGRIFKKQNKESKTAP